MVKNNAPRCITVALSTFSLSHCNCFSVILIKLNAVIAGQRGIQLIQHFLPECTGASISSQSNCNLQETVHLPYKEKSTGRCGSEKLPAGQVAHFRKTSTPRSNTHTNRHPLSSLHTPPLCVLTHTPISQTQEMHPDNSLSWLKAFKESSRGCSELTLNQIVISQKKKNYSE